MLRISASYQPIVIGISVCNAKERRMGRAIIIAANAIKNPKKISATRPILRISYYATIFNGRDVPIANSLAEQQTLTRYLPLVFRDNPIQIINLNISENATVCSIR